MPPSLRQFLECVLGDEEGVAELRCFGGRFPKGKKEFFKYPAHLDHFVKRAQSLSGETGVYFGVGLRDKEGGTKEDVKSIHALWIDVDENSKEVLQAVKKFPLKPSIGVYSGRPGGVHIYWLLKEPVTGDDLKKVRPYLLALAKHFGTDRGACDIARVLRLPGTINIKYDNRPECRVNVLHADRAYNLEDFEEYLTIEEGDTPKQVEPPDELPNIDIPEGLFQKLFDQLSEIWIDNYRHQMALCISGMLAHNGVSEASAIALVRAVSDAAGGNTENHITSVRTTYKNYLGGKPITGGPSAEVLVEQFPELIKEKAKKILSAIRTSVKKKKGRPERGLNFRVDKIVKFPSRPASYKITITMAGGKTVVVDIDETPKLAKFWSFKTEALDQCDVMLIGKQNLWETAIGHALDSIEVTEGVEEATPEGMVKNCLDSFLKRSREKVDVGMLKSIPGHDDKMQFFSTAALKKQLKEAGVAMSQQRLCSLLKSEGWESKTKRFGPGPKDTARVWFRDTNEDDNGQLLIPGAGS